MGLTLRVLGIATLIVCSYGTQTKANEGPVYQRHRGSAAYGYPSDNGHSWNPPGSPYGFQGLYGFQGFYQQPIAGSWFERPYPQHLDYHRLRHRSPPPAQDCPCAKNPAPTPSVP